MFQFAANPNSLQCTARRVFIVLCVVFALGLVGAVTVRAVDAPIPAVRFIKETPTADIDDVDLAEAQLASATIQPELATENPPAAHSVSSSTPSSRIMLMEVTAYCPCPKCCGPKAQGITASGKHVSYNDGRFVAADTRHLPFGTQIQIPGYHNEAKVEVIDRGGAIKGNKLDVFFPTHQEALEWGRQWVAVKVLN